MEVKTPIFSDLKIPHHYVGSYPGMAPGLSVVSETGKNRFLYNCYRFKGKLKDIALYAAAQTIPLALMVMACIIQNREEALVFSSMILERLWGLLYWQGCNLPCWCFTGCGRPAKYTKNDAGYTAAVIFSPKTDTLSINSL